MYHEDNSNADVLPKATRYVGERTVGWRLVWNVTDLSRDPLSWSGDWRSSEYASVDKAAGNRFCLADVERLPRGQRFTRIMAIEGEGGAYEQIRQNGWANILKAAPDAILLIEVVNSQTPWMAAGDLDLDKCPHAIHPKTQLGIGANSRADGFLIGFVDGAVWSLDESIPFTELEKFLTVEGARAHDRESILKPYSKLNLMPADFAPFVR